MKPSEVLRRAARNIARGVDRLGCVAISTAVWHELNLRKKLTMGEIYAIEVRARYYFRMVAPPQIPNSGFWWRRYDSDPHIIGLCLAAAIAESEGD